MPQAQIEKLEKKLPKKGTFKTRKQIKAQERQCQND